MTATLEQIEALLTNIEAIAHGLQSSMPVGGQQILVTGLDDMSDNLGLIKAGEFRSGTGIPGSATQPFTGIRMGAPGWTYSSTKYSIVGLNDDVLQFGLCNTDGKLYAAGGDIRLSSSGIDIYSDTSGGGGYINFYVDDSGTIHTLGYVRGAYLGSAAEIQIFSQKSATSPWVTPGAQVVVGVNDQTLVPAANPAYTTWGTDAPAIYGSGGFIFNHGIFVYDGVLRKYVDSTHAYTGYIYVPCPTPLTSTDWDGDAKATDADGIIDLSVVFGAPAGIKGIACRLETHDETAGVFVSLGPSATYNDALGIYTQVTDALVSGSGVVPCDANGDVYFQLDGEVDHVLIKIYGYFI